MARIGRNVDFNVTFETFTNGYLKWLPTRPTAGSTPDPYVAKLSAGNGKPVNVDIYGEALDLLSLQTYVEDRNVIFTNNGNAINPEPGPEPPEPPPPYDVEILKQAIRNIKDEDIAAYWVRVLAEYTTLGGTGTPPTTGEVNKGLR